MSTRYQVLRSHIVQSLLAAGGGARTSTLNELGADQRDLARMHQDGTLRRVARGYYTLTGPQPEVQRGRLRSEHLRQLAAVAGGDSVGSLRSGALAWDLPVIAIPPRPEIIRPPGSHEVVNTRTLRRRLPGPHVRTLHGVPVTSMARTVIELALDLPVPDAAITVDAVLRRGVSRTELHQVLAGLGAVRGSRRARTTIDWADPHAESPLESRGRGELMLRGVPRPMCNVSFRLDRTEFRADMWWPGIPLVGEADGAEKYDAAVDGRSLWAEKLRQEWFESEVGLLMLRFIDRELRSAPESLVARFRRLSGRASATHWDPPSALEIFQRPSPGSGGSTLWLKRRGEVYGQNSK